MSDYKGPTDRWMEGESTRYRALALLQCGIERTYVESDDILPHFDSSTEEDVGNAILFGHPLVYNLMDAVLAARHVAANTTSGT